MSTRKQSAFARVAPVLVVLLGIGIIAIQLLQTDRLFVDIQIPDHPVNDELSIGNEKGYIPTAAAKEESSSSTINSGSGHTTNNVTGPTNARVPGAGGGNLARGAGAVATQQILSELPVWAREYAEWHREQRAAFLGGEGRAAPAKFLVVACQEGARCGGLSDRLQGLLYWLRQAEQTGRVLLLSWTKGRPLEDFWVPPAGGIDWTVPRNTSAATLFGASSCVYDRRKNLAFPRQNHRKALRNAADRQVVCVLSQSPLNDQAVQSNYYAAANESTTIRTFSQFYQIMFAPAPALREFIDASMASMDLRPDSAYLAAQVRSLYPLRNGTGLVRPTMGTHPALVQSWATRAVRSVVNAYREGGGDSGTALPVYVTADDPKVVRFLKSGDSDMSKAVVGLESMPRPHVEFAATAGDAPLDELFPAFLDLWMLSHARCVAYGLGGYGRLGASLGGTGCAVRHRRSQSWSDYEAPIPARAGTVLAPPHPASSLNGFSRTAYLITVNATSPRTVRSAGILEGVGFHVQLIFADAQQKDKVVSNKRAQLLIYETLLATPDQWGYIFEDDIALAGVTPSNFKTKVNFTVAGDLPALEAEGCLSIYLGVCAPFRPFTAKEGQANRYCGTCAHAYGVSRGGARRLLEYHRRMTEGPSARPRLARYMDQLIKGVCMEVGGFPVSRVKTASPLSDAHRGSFVQDRGSFPSLISAPKK